MAWDGMAGLRITLSYTDTYHTVPMLRLGTGVANLAVIIGGGCC